MLRFHVPLHRQGNRRSHFAHTVHSHHPLPDRSHLQQTRQWQNDPFCCMTLLAIEWSLLQRKRQPHYFTFYVFTKNCLFPLGIGSPSNTWYLWPTRVIISIGSVIFVWVPNDMLYNALSMGKKTPKLPLPLGISSPCRRRTKLQP